MYTTKQSFYQPIGNRFSVLPISQHALVISKCEYGQTLRCVLLPDGGFERFRTFIIAVGGDKDDSLTLAYLVWLKNSVTSRRSAIIVAQQPAEAISTLHRAAVTPQG